MKSLNIIPLVLLSILFVRSSCEIEDPLEVENKAPQSFELLWPISTETRVHACDFRLSWDYAIDTDGQIRSYHVYLGCDNNLEFLDSVTTNKYHIDTLKALTTYYWQVEAFDDDGASVKSEVKSFITDDPTGVPYPIYPANGMVDVTIPINFEWGCDNTLIDGSEIYITEASGGDYIMVPDNTAYSDLKPNTKYYWWVIGVDRSKEQNSEGYYWRGESAEFTTK